MAEKVYEEWGHELIESHHNKKGTVYYRVFFGTVNWDKTPGGMEPAISVLMQYGDTEDWKEAKSNEEIAFGMPAHILKEDFREVMKAKVRLAKKHGWKLKER